MNKGSPTAWANKYRKEHDLCPIQPPPPRWKLREKSQLYLDWKVNPDLNALADKYNRSVNAVRVQLQKMGML